MNSRTEQINVVQFPSGCDLTDPRHGYWYVATPYSKHPRGTESAYREACEATALLIRAGITVFSPIAHSHAIAIYGGIDPLDHELWMRVDRPMVDAACGCIVVEMDGWQDSRGVAVEIELFSTAGRPIIHMTPGVVPECFREVTP